MRLEPKTISRKRAFAYGIAAAACGAGIFIGAGVASASTGTAATGHSGGGGWVAQISCDDLTNIQGWVQNRIGVIGSDASVKGSTSWAEQELAAAQTAGDTDRAAKLQQLLDHRAAHPDHWQHVAQRVQKVQDRRCS